MPLEFFWRSDRLSRNGATSPSPPPPPLSAFCPPLTPFLSLNHEASPLLRSWRTFLLSRGSKQPGRRLLWSTSEEFSVDMKKNVCIPETHFELKNRDWVVARVKLGNGRYPPTNCYHKVGRILWSPNVLIGRCKIQAQLKTQVQPQTTLYRLLECQGS